MIRILRAIPNVCRPCIQACLFNPIVGKELRVSARRRRTYWMRGVYLTIAVSVMLLAWWAIVEAGEGGISMMFEDSSGQAAQLQARSLVGRQLSLVLGWTQLLAFTLLSPILTSSAISDEIEDRTLHVLLITPLTSFQIVIGKVISRLAHVFLLILLSVPLLLAMRLYGGFNLPQLIQIELLCVASSIFGASVGLLMSCWEKRAWRAVAMSYFWIGLWWIAIPIGLLIGCRLLIESAWFRGSGMIEPTVAAGWLTFVLGAFVPIAGMGYLTEDLITGGMPDMITATPVMCLASLVHHVVLSLILMLLAVLLVGRRGSMTGDEHSPQRKVAKRKTTKPAAVAVSPTRAPLQTDEETGVPAVARSALTPRGVKGTGPITRTAARLDPLILRELKTRIFRKRRDRIVALVALGLLLIWFYIWGKPWEYPEAHIAVIWSGIFLSLILSAVLSALPITSEKQSRTWEPLLCTPTQPARIILFKVASVWLKAAVPLAFAIAHLAIFLPSRYVSFIIITHTAMIGMMCILISSATGICCSLLCRRTGTALLLNLGLLFFLWLILPLLTISLGGIGLDYYGRPYVALVSIVLWPNPLYWLTSALTLGVLEFGGHFHYELEVPEMRLTTTSMTLVLLVPLAWSLVFSGALLATGILAFDRLTGRPKRGPLRLSRFSLSWAGRAGTPQH